MKKAQAEDVMKIGLVDADLLDGGTRHPNLALLKLAGFLNDHNIEFRLIESENEDVSEYHLIYISKVFSFTKDPKFFNRSQEEKKGKNLVSDGAVRVSTH